MVSYPNGTGVPLAFLATNSSSQGHGLCKRCHYGGCDLQVRECGCFLHARCTPISQNSALTNCPMCGSSVRSLFLMPMNFDEIDEAKAQAAAMSPSSKRGKKRKNATIARLNPNNSNVDEPNDGSDLRTGRWTSEEIGYCDKLIEKFEKGHLPISDGTKLNDFLASMLKSKQSRLTKKMKNAKLSAKTYKRSTGFVSAFDDAQEFSQLESAFYESIQCNMERSEIRFHMQKEWRELLSAYCVSMGQNLDATSWLSSVEEMDKRVSQAKDAARMARRKVLMGYALTHDSSNQAQGVFIERSTSVGRNNDALTSHASSNSLAKLDTLNNKKPRPGNNSATALKGYSSPFVGRVVQYLQRHKLPFEHVDAWVPSFVQNAEQATTDQCRLCFAGFASCDLELPVGGGAPVPISTQRHFDMLSFGEYSAKFSFDVGCGLPGRVYKSSVCSWEQGVENAPSNQFERCGGAAQWGIKTVLGIPVPSPNVGRIVVLLYSGYDRPRDPDMVQRITAEITKLQPTPKWKLVVDLGVVAPAPKVEKQVDRRVSELLQLLAKSIPTQATSPFAMYLPGFTMLQMLLSKQGKSPQELEVQSTMLESYSSYLASGRSPTETASMCARDCMLLCQTNGASLQPQQIQSGQQAPAAAQQVNQGLHAQFMQQQQPQQLQLIQNPSVNFQQAVAQVHPNPANLVLPQQAKMQQPILQHQRSMPQMMQLNAAAHQSKPDSLSPVPAASQNYMNMGALQYHNAGGQYPGDAALAPAVSVFHPPSNHH